jgi:hypothetical protein
MVREPMEMLGLAFHQLAAAAGSATADSASEAAAIIKGLARSTRLAVAGLAEGWVSCGFIIRG